MAAAAAAAAGSSNHQGNALIFNPELKSGPEQLEKRRSYCHVPTFSAQHPIIPKLYVMPWKQDMKNQRLLMKNAALARIPVVALEESLCVCGRERLCHSFTSSSSSSSSSAALSHSGLPAHHSSHLSRYNSAVITAQSLFQA